MLRDGQKDSGVLRGYDLVESRIVGWNTDSVCARRVSGGLGLCNRSSVASVESEG